MRERLPSISREWWPTIAFGLLAGGGCIALGFVDRVVARHLAGSLALVAAVVYLITCGYIAFDEGRDYKRSEWAPPALLFLAALTLGLALIFWAIKSP